MLEQRIFQAPMLQALMATQRDDVARRIGPSVTMGTAQ